MQLMVATGMYTVYSAVEGLCEEYCNLKMGIVCKKASFCGSCGVHILTTDM